MAERHVRKRHIGDIAAAAAQQSHIFETGNALPDPIFAHCLPSS